MVFVKCEEDQCGIESGGVAAAAKALGWNFKTLSFDESNPATLVSALNEALQYKPVAVYFAGVPEQAWASVEPAYQKAGAIIIPDAIPSVTPSAVVPTQIAANPYFTKLGTLLANEVIASSGGHANVLLLSVPQYPIFVPVAAAFKATLASGCPACKVTTTVAATIPELIGGQIVPMVVSALRSAPSTNYIASVDGPFIAGLPSALSAAGLGGKFKIVSGTAGANNEQDIISGTELASTGEGLAEVGWLAVDATLRHLEGMALPDYDSIYPAPLLTKSNIGSPPANGDYDTPANYASQFEQLWKVS